MIDLRLLIAAVAVAVALSGTSFAASQRTVDVITHAAFFSEEMKQSEVVDPHVFVQDIVAPELSARLVSSTWLDCVRP